MTAIDLAVDYMSYGSAATLTTCQSDQNGKALALSILQILPPGRAQFFHVLAIIPSSSRSPTPRYIHHRVRPLLFFSRILVRPCSTCFDSRLWTERKEAAQDRFYVSWFILLQSSCFAPHTRMCLKHCAEIPGDVFFTRRRAMIAPCRRERAESLEPELEHAWADYEAPVDNEGFGYEVLVVQGLKVPFKDPVTSCLAFLYFLVLLCHIPPSILISLFEIAGGPVLDFGTNYFRSIHWTYVSGDYGSNALVHAYKSNCNGQDRQVLSVFIKVSPQSTTHSLICYRGARIAHTPQPSLE